MKKILLMISVIAVLANISFASSDNIEKKDEINEVLEKTTAETNADINSREITTETAIITES